MSLDKIQIQEAKILAKKASGYGSIIFVFQGDEFKAVSWGEDKATCKNMKFILECLSEYICNSNFDFQG